MRQEEESMNPLSVGDKVTVREDLENHEIYDGFFFVESIMGRYLGKRAIIIGVSGPDEYLRGYSISTDEGKTKSPPWFTMSMFSAVKSVSHEDIEIENDEHNLVRFLEKFKLN